MEGLHPWWPAWVPLHPHLLLEALAYAVGFRILVRDRARAPDPVPDELVRATLFTVGVVGAAVASKASYWLEDPAATLAHLRDPLWLLGGRSIVGALLGGWLGVEVAKRVMGVTVATGDLYVKPLVVGMMIGRLGCFFAGVTDGTHGVPSAVPWAMDLGDGVPRHPTALYEIAFLGLLGVVLARWEPPRNGDRFLVFVASYLLYRLWAETLKTQPFPWAGWSGIQVLCGGGLLAAAGLRLARWRADRAARTTAEPGPGG